jgi:hypothetical protein
LLTGQIAVILARRIPERNPLRTLLETTSGRASRRTRPPVSTP